MKTLFGRWLIALMLLAVIPQINVARAQAPNPWDTPQGQACFEQWIAETSAKLNAYNGDAEHNGRKPWSFSRYGQLEGNPRTGPRYAYAPDDFPQHNYNKYWWMWDQWYPYADGTWRYPEWNAARIESIRTFVTNCVAKSAGPLPPPGPPVPSGPGTRPSGGATGRDPDNKLGDCETNWVAFGNNSADKSRCFTFRFPVPAGGITRAILHVSIKTDTGGDPDTDWLVAGVGQSIPECGLQGKMAGCARLYDGIRGTTTSIDLDLFDIKKCSNITPTETEQKAVIAQLQTGVLHLIFTDDTNVLDARLVLNDPNEPSCVSPTTPGVSNMAIQVVQRQVIAGDLVLVPVWLIKANNIANINYQITYDANVARPEGRLTQGNLLDNALFSVNPNQSGNILSGFAKTSGVSGTGTILNIPFRAVGKPGDRTTLNVTVTTINDPSGAVPKIDRIPGEILIYNKDGTFPPPPPGGPPGPPPPPSILLGDCDGDASLTEVDALCALEMSVQLRPSQSIVDMDKSGDVTSRDAVLILQRAINK